MSNKKLNAKKFVAGGIKLLQDSNRGRNTISIMNMFRATILLLGNVVVLLVGGSGASATTSPVLLTGSMKEKQKEAARNA
ncbi:MAG TPA: hypothetical protein PKI93_08800, partial [Alphaproteobacteria bacterium]|nr:hypothetical protein [Alphaproteobacteria bacterium]